jgi:hypothetical protein
MNEFETVNLVKKMEFKAPKLMWSKNPHLEKAALAVILNGYKENVNQKTVGISIWDSVAKDVIKSVDPKLKIQQQITGTSIRSFFRNLKKMYLEYTKE